MSWEQEGRGVSLRDCNRILDFLADEKLRTRDEIHTTLGFDPTEELEVLFKEGKIAVVRASGYAFWQINTAKPPAIQRTSV